MNIVVCIKQVPDTAEVKINPETNTLIRDGVENIMNPFDRQALETALILKDTSGAKVTVVSMGPPQATDILKEAIAMGADDAVLISDRALAGSDTLATSVALAAAVRKVGECDLVLCGKQAIDGDTAQVGPEMAEHLGIPQVTGALKVALGADGRLLDVRDLDVDFLSASAHKFNGPKGIGFLYIKEGLKINPLISGGAQENSLRAGTENIASIVAMAIALEENTSQLEDNMTYIQGLENALIQKLLSLNVVFHKNGAEVKIPGNVSLSFNGFSGESLLHRLDLLGICVATGSACDSRNTQISHVLKAIQLNESLAKGTIRISLGKDNTYDDVNRIAEVLASVVK